MNVKNYRVKLSPEDCIAAERLARKYKETRDKDAAEELLYIFRGIIAKFLNLLKEGRNDTCDPYINNFLKLFIKNKAIRNTADHKISYVTRFKIRLQIQGFKVRGFYHGYSRDEILNVLIEAFLIMTTKYKPYHSEDEAHFHQYVLRVYHYYVLNSLKRLTWDALGRKHDSMAEDFQYVDFDIDKLITEVDNNYLVGNLRDDLDDNWINGFTCSEIFLNLTPFQRRILKLYFKDELPDREIAERLGVCRATVNRKRLAAIKTIMEGSSCGEEN